MITSEKQYKITLKNADRFQRALDEFEKSSHKDISPLLVKAERDAMASQLAELRAELEEYQRLKSSDISVISISSFDELADGLIKARIAADISQQELAERIGLKEQQIQRYEAGRYSSASYQRLLDITGALGVRIQNNILLPVAPSNFKTLMDKLQQVGLDQDFLLSRLLPSADATLAAEVAGSEDEDKFVARIGALLCRIFGWTLPNLFGPEPLELPRFAATNARCKTLTKRGETTTSLYAIYANFLARTVLDGASDLPKKSIPDNPATLRKAIITRHGIFNFEMTLNYSWDLGIPVLPLQDSGTFHGACWRYAYRNIIVLKQNSPHESRWLFDLIHELFHAAQKPDAETMEIIEADETTAERRESDEEIAASQFAGDVILDGRTEELAKKCVSAAHGSVKRFKKIVPDIADQEKVGTGDLANYMAFRLSLEKTNWWGAASNLQSGDANPWETARDVFMTRFPFANDSDTDHQLLNRALN